MCLRFALGAVSGFVRKHPGARRWHLNQSWVVGCWLFCFFSLLFKQKYRSFDLGHSIGVTFESEKVQFDGASSRNK